MPENIKIVLSDGDSVLSLESGLVSVVSIMEMLGKNSIISIEASSSGFSDNWVAIIGANLTDNTSLVTQ